MAQRLASGLKGFETRVLALDSPGGNELDAAAGESIRRVCPGRWPGVVRNVVLNASALREALRFRPDATLSMHIVTAPAAAAVRRALGAPTVQYFHANEIVHRPRLAAFAARRAGAAIAVSSYTASLIAATGESRADIRLIPPGVDLPLDSPGVLLDAPGVDLRPERPAVVTISRLEDRYKGHDVLIRALPAVRAQVPDVEWVVIGDGSLRPDLEALARAHGVADCVRFLGAVPDERRDCWLRRADVLAMPSRLPGGRLAGEGFGIVYLEAAAHGKPVLAGNVAGALDAVVDGETGLLVDPTDPCAVGDALTRLLLDRELARRLGAAGARRARGYAWPRVAERVDEVLRDQLERSRRPVAERRRRGRSARTPA